MKTSVMVRLTAALLTGVALPLLLTACVAEPGSAIGIEELSSRHSRAARLIDARDWSLSSLLETQDYFFSFSELVSNTLTDAEALASLRAAAAQKTPKEWCETLLLSTSRWKALDQHCADPRGYRCSPDMEIYPAQRDRLLHALGSGFSSRYRDDPACR